MLKSKYGLRKQDMEVVIWFKVCDSVLGPLDLFSCFFLTLFWFIELTMLIKMNGPMQLNYLLPLCLCTEIFTYRTIASRLFVFP